MIKKIYTEYISFIVAAVIMVTCIPAGIVAAVSGNELEILSGGSPVTSLLLKSGEKTELQAAGMPDGTRYTWQILIPETLTWTDIHDMNTSTCEASYALIKGLWDISGKTALRCKTLRNGSTVISDPVAVALEAEEPAKKLLFPAKAAKTALRAATPDTTDINAQSEYVHITIEYRLGNVTGEKIFSDYTATLSYGTSFNAAVPSPSYVGYSPYIMINGEETEAAQVQLSYKDLIEDKTLIVYYKPAMSSYTVRYFLQNVTDDGYTEYAEYAYTGSGETGTYPKEDIEKKIDGFTALFHEPDTIAADGSTVFYVYYDRNYYLYVFDCDGGYGVDPVYARYGTQLIVPEPTKPGYKHTGWTRVSEDGTEIETVLPSAIGTENCRFKAKWEAVDTTFTVVYWNENPDDNDYSYWTSIEIPCKSGTVLTPDCLAEDDKMISKIPPTGKDSPIDESELQHYKYDINHTKEVFGSEVIVEGNGSTIINIYYSRNSYTLRFYYAKSIEEENKLTGEKERKYYVVGGTTYGFGNGGSGISAPNSSDLNDLMANVTGGTEGNWGEVEEPKLTSEAQKIYTPGSLTLDDGFTYHYISITKKYQSLLENVWPTTETFEKPFIKFDESGTRSKHAVFSAWNGECYVKYTQDHSNQTIKGRYLRLDDDILYAQKYQNEYYYDDDGNRLVRYLAFWENGAKNSWNYARKWNYEIYREPLPVEIETFYRDNPGAEEKINNKQIVEEKMIDGSVRYWRWFDGNSDIYTEIKVTPGVYYSYGKYVCCDNNDDTNPSSQTPPGTLGYNLVSGQFSRSLLSESEKEYYYGNYQYTGTFFFKRQKYNLRLYNQGTWLSDKEGTVGSGFNVKFGRIMQILLNGIINLGAYDESELETLKDYPKNILDGLKPKYPATLEPNSYQFEGWYTSPKFLDGTELTEDFTMPASNTTLYANWVPISHEVTFSANYDRMINKNYVGGKIYEIEHSNELPTSAIPDWNDLKAELDRDNYEFVGWFYEDENNVKHPFEPSSMQVITDMHLYAEWRSSEIVQYTVHYVEENTDTKVADDTVGYTYAGTTKTFTAKAGDQLFENCRTGWFPKINSHSIIAGEEDSYTFEYVKKGKLSYTVRYLEMGTDKELLKPKTNESDKAVVTEKFEPIDGYISDSFYKTLVLSTEGENIITFYYTANSSDVYYAVEHYTENLDGSGYTLYSSSELIGKLKDTIRAEAITISGFTYDEKITETNNKYIADAKVDQSGVSATVVQDLVIKIFYKRNTFKYKVIYADYGDPTKILNTVEEGSALYGTQKIHSAPDELKSDRDELYTRVSPPEQKLEVRDNDDQTLIFYYQARMVTISYIAVTLKGGRGGVTTPAFETVSGTFAIMGSTPTANSGYRFAGWYHDETCKTPVDESWILTEEESKLKPAQLDYPDGTPDNIRDNTYYALFEPITSDLTITKTVNSPAVQDKTLLFSVTGEAGSASENISLTVAVTGSGSVTIKNLPIGNYTVRELSGWSWRHNTENGAEKTVSLTLETANNTVAFTNSDKDTAWLGGEAASTNHFTEITY